MTENTGFPEKDANIISLDQMREKRNSDALPRLSVRARSAVLVELMDHHSLTKPFIIEARELIKKQLDEVPDPYDKILMLLPVLRKVKDRRTLHWAVHLVMELAADLPFKTRLSLYALLKDKAYETREPQQLIDIIFKNVEAMIAAISAPELVAIIENEYINTDSMILLTSILMEQYVLATEKSIEAYIFEILATCLSSRELPSSHKDRISQLLFQQLGMENTFKQHVPEDRPWAAEPIEAVSWKDLIEDEKPKTWAEITNPGHVSTKMSDNFRYDTYGQGYLLNYRINSQSMDVSALGKKASSIEKMPEKHKSADEKNFEEVKG